MGSVRQKVVKNFDSLINQIQAVQMTKRKQSDKLLRAIDCYAEGFLFLDTQARGWTIMHCNQSAIAISGGTQ